MGEWVSKQRKKIKNNLLSDTQKELLKELNFSVDYFSEEWMKYYSFLIEFCEKNGHSYVNKNHIVIDPESGIKYNLGRWVSRQRNREDSLTEERKRKLSEINFVFNVRDSQWNSYYNLLKEFYEKNGHSNVPYNIVIIDEKNNIQYKLGRWVLKLREKENRLTDYQKNKLKEVDFNFDYLKGQWNCYYALLKEYYEKKGNSDVPCNYKTVDMKTKITYNLGSWAARQRNNEDKLSHEQKDKLSQVNFIYDYFDKQWNENYNMLKNFYIENGHSNIPYTYKVTNTSTSQIVDLGTWAARQRNREDRLTDLQKMKLTEINFIYNLNESKWNKNYELLKKYYDENGHSIVPADLNVIDSKTGVVINLGRWVSKQRLRYNKLSDYQKNKLKEVDFVNDALITRWNKNYNMLKDFYIKNGHSVVPRDYVAEDGSLLGIWAGKQRLKADKLSNEQIKLLNEVNYIFSLKENKNEIETLCIDYGLSFKKYKQIFSRSSFDFMKMKILYLLECDLPLEKNGELHEIFSMSNENMMATYNVSNEELYNRYIVNLIKK